MLIYMRHFSLGHPVDMKTQILFLVRMRQCITKKFTITISYGNIILIYSRQRRKLGHYKYFSNMKSQIEACIQLFVYP